jgi:hypothetical protein
LIIIKLPLQGPEECTTSFISTQGDAMVEINCPLRANMAFLDYSTSNTFTFQNLKNLSKF